MLFKMISKAALADTLIHELEKGNTTPLKENGHLKGAEASAFYKEREDFWTKAIFGEHPKNSIGHLIRYLSQRDPNEFLFWEPLWLIEDIQELYWSNNAPDIYSDYIDNLEPEEHDKFLKEFITLMSKNYDPNIDYSWDSLHEMLVEFTKEKVDKK